MRYTKFVFSCVIGCAACGRTSLWDTERLDATGGVAAESGTTAAGGAPPSAGGAFSDGGTRAEAGTFGRGGTFAVSGSGSGGTTEMGGTGSVPVCLLAANDCATANEPECGDHPKCTGAIKPLVQLRADVAHIEELATSADGRVVAGGSFRGTIDFSGKFPLTSVDDPSSPDSLDAFVAAFDSSGTPLWSFGYTTFGDQSITGIDIAPNGDVLVQSASNAKNESPAVLFRLSPDGQLINALQWGDGATSLSPGGVAVSNDGDIWAVGSFEGTLTIGSQSSISPTPVGYVAHLGADLNLLELSPILPTGDWARFGLSRVVVDDEDSVLLLGNGLLTDGSYGAFVRKRSSARDADVDLDFRNISLTALAVDRRMNVVIAGLFPKVFENGGERFVRSPQGLADAWLAQYSREGSINWQRQVKSAGPLAAVPRAVTTDPFGNVLVAGLGSKLFIDDHTVQVAGQPTMSFIFKLRPDGDYLWARADNVGQWLAAAADNAGSTWVGGFFGGTSTLDGETVVSTGQRNGLLAKLSP